MIQVKICGLTAPEEVRAVNEAGADYAGFVFYPESRRNVSPGQAQRLLSLLDPAIRSAAVCVSPEKRFSERLPGMGFDIISDSRRPSGGSAGTEQYRNLAGGKFCGARESGKNSDPSRSQRIRGGRSSLGKRKNLRMGDCPGKKKPFPEGCSGRHLVTGNLFWREV